MTKGTGTKRERKELLGNFEGSCKKRANFCETNVQPDVKISRSLIDGWCRATGRHLTSRIFFGYLCLAAGGLFTERPGLKGEFILSRPRRQISGIESLFSIRTPSLRTTFAPSSRRNWYWRSQFAILFRLCHPSLSLSLALLLSHTLSIQRDRDTRRL